MHDIVYSLAQLSNNDVEHLDKDKNANGDDGDDSSSQCSYMQRISCIEEWRHE